MERIIRIGTRKSPLALKQVKEIIDAISGRGGHTRYEIVALDTPGDIDKQTPLSDVEGSDFFTKGLDEALLGGRIDCAVHSAKDLPDKIRMGLAVVCMTDASESSDALVSKNGLNFFDLPHGARIGASSRRRKEAINRLRPDVCVCDIRGTIGERIAQLDHGQLDAIVIATIALLRLGLANRITEKLDTYLFPINPLQGRIAVVARETDQYIKNIFEKKNESALYEEYARIR